MRDPADARHVMVEDQLRRRGISDERVLAAMRHVRRELFVAADLAGHAYDDKPLPIESGQTVSQPFMLASMLEAAQIGAEDSVLEVGTGSGYAAAVLGRLTRSVHTIERDTVLFEAARPRLDRRVKMRLADGSLGWPEAAPFDAIVVMAAAASVPPALKPQLALGGRMLIPIGDGAGQHLVKLTRLGTDDYRQQSLGAVMFVPLVLRP